MSDDARRPTRGFLLVDKAEGWTSHDVVARVRKIASMKKVGHAGTLDPMATGLLVVALGRATRLLRYVQGARKEYIAEAVFGVATDTLDADGAILTREPLPVSAEEVEAAMVRFRGEIHQVPPMVSARRVGGTRLYELARRGEEVEREARPVVIDELELLDFSPSQYPEVLFRVVCSTGTYVRTLADDIAASLGGRAHLSALRRLRIGSLRVDEAHTIADLDEAAADDALAELVLSPADALRDLPAVVIEEDLEPAVRHGMAISRLGGVEGASDGSPVVLLDGEGSLLAVYRVKDHGGRPEVVLA